MNPARTIAPLAAFALGLSLLACGGATAPVATPLPATPPASSAAVVAAPASSARPAALGALEQLRHDATKLDGIVTTPGVKRFLARVATLPHVATRTLYHDEKKTHYYTEKQASALEPAAKAALKTRVADEELYYNTKYGSPLSYARPLDILFSKGIALPQGGEGARLRPWLHRAFALAGDDGCGRDRGRRRSSADSALRRAGRSGEFRGPEGETGHVRLIEGASRRIRRSWPRWGRGMIW